LEMDQSTLRELYIKELRDLYDAEKQLTKALPKMAEATTSTELRSGIERHLEQTKGHVQRLEQIFETLGEKPTGETCKGMEGVIKEGDELAKDKKLHGAVRDAGIITAAQRVEHYEIAAYGCVRAFAELLKDDKAVNLLQQTLQEEKDTNEKLTEMSKEINVEALGGQKGAEGSKSRSARA
jgi:ferritin-like metal-binding protein YciE